MLLPRFCRGFRGLRIGFEVVPFSPIGESGSLENCLVLNAQVKHLQYKSRCYLAANSSITCVFYADVHQRPCGLLKNKIKPPPSPAPVGFPQSGHRTRRGRALCERWSPRLGTWDAVFPRRQMRDLGREGSALRNSSPRLRRQGSAGDIGVHRAALEVKGEGTSQGHQPERASDADRVPGFPGHHPARGPPWRASSSLGEASVGSPP